MTLTPFGPAVALLATTLIGPTLVTSGPLHASEREAFSPYVQLGQSAGREAARCGPAPTSRSLGAASERVATSSPAGIRVRTEGLGGGACCLPAGACEDVDDPGECSGLGGFFFDGTGCATDPCGVGACCSEGSCSLSDAYGCLSAGREFAGAGTDCLSDPCGGGVGACCKDGNCLETGLDACSQAGGSWLGAGTLCADQPCAIGSCCSPGACDAIAQFECELSGGVFEISGACEPGSCEVENDCATDSLYTQARDLPQAFTAYTSELAAGFERWENYSGAVGAIREVTWWGLDMEFTGGGFIECTDPSGLFAVTLHQDVAGRPGEAVCSFQGIVQQTATGIDYAGAELNEYRVRLPEACVLTQGWISIRGGGDPDCWFLWMSSAEGDDRSLCEGCESRMTGDDLSLCLGGEAGGISGSCCDASTGVCTDGVDISDCVTVGQTFGPNQLCADLDPPCTAETGACCKGDGACSDQLPADCVALGGQWLGADAPCALCPSVGACCSGAKTCSLTTEAECQDQAANWLGDDTLCAECPTVPECGPNSLFPQSPDGPDDFIAGTSEAGTPFTRSENFQAVPGVTRAVRWWGLDLDNIEGTDDFVECIETDPTFDLTVSKDAGGVPGEALCSSTVLAQRLPLGLLYLGTELNEYRAVLPEACAATEGWLSIVGRGDPECWFLWMSGGLGDSHCAGCIPEAQDFDLALCLGGAPGGATGACCDDATGACGDGVDIRECAEPSLRFAADTLCSDLTPPCGTVLGACCRNDATCDRRTLEDCLASGGHWQGPDTLCDSCPCAIPCPASAHSEGEPTCSDGYEDRFNAGCNAFPPTFSTLELGETVCGSSGLFLDGLEVVGDSDWYEIDVDQAGVLTWSATAEFVSTVSVYDAAQGCPGTLLGARSALECGTATVAVAVDPGTYWLVIEPSVFTDAAACPASYTARVALEPESRSSATSRAATRSGARPAH